MVVTEATTLAGLGELLQLGEAGVTGFLKVGFYDDDTDRLIGNAWMICASTALHTDTHTHAQHSLPRLDYQTTTLGHLGFNGLRW